MQVGLTFVVSYSQCFEIALFVGFDCVFESLAFPSIILAVESLIYVYAFTLYLVRGKVERKKHEKKVIVY